MTRSTHLTALLAMFMLPLAAYGADKPPSCELMPQSILSRSSSGVPEVSNLGDIGIRCSIPSRPFPSRPGESRSPPQAKTVAYMLSADGKKEVVPSEVKQTGGGFDPDREWILFYVHLPLDPAEADAESRRLLEKVWEAAKTMPGSQPAMTEEARKRVVEGMRELVYQHRVGRFVVQCQLLAQDELLGSAEVNLEVVYKGRFSDAGLPGAPPA